MVWIQDSVYGLVYGRDVEGVAWCGALDHDTWVRGRERAQDPQADPAPDGVLLPPSAAAAATAWARRASLEPAEDAVRRVFAGSVDLFVEALVPHLLDALGVTAAGPPPSLAGPDATVTDPPADRTTDLR